MDSRRFNRLVEKVRWVRNQRVVYDRIYSEHVTEHRIIPVVRERLSLTQDQLADLIGVSADEIYKWEYGICDLGCAEKIVLWIAFNYPEVFLEAAHRIRYE